MTRIAPVPATLDDLYREPGKAELVGGTIVRLKAAGHKPGLTGFRITMSLNDYAASEGKGIAYPTNVGFAVPRLVSGRESFSPDSAYYTGPPPVNPMRFIEGAPDFAAEVRSESDYGDSAEQEMADKRADYFAAGTAVVWDVDPVAEVAHDYRATAPTTPKTYRRGEVAEAEPAVPGWRMPVDAIFT